MNATESADTEYLSGFDNQLASNASDYVHQRISQALCPHEMRLLGASELSPHLRMLRLSDVSVVELRYGSHVEIHPGAHDNLYLFRLTLNGHGLIGFRDREIPIRSGSLTVTSPGDDALIRIYPDCHSLLLRVTRRALENALVVRLGGEMTDALRFEPSLNPTHPGVDFLRNTVNYLAHVSRGLAQAPEVSRQIAHMEHYLCDSLLTLFPHNYQDRLNGHPMPLPGYLKRAKALVDQSASHTVPLARLAEACGVSCRTLQYGFREFLGCSPRSYMERCRIEAVHEALTTSARGTRVTDILLHHGINSPGHFTGRYRERYGETPSDTLRRSDT